MTEPLVVLYDDPHILAIAKAAGQLTQGISSGEPAIEDAVRRFVGASNYLGTVHRLDRPVSGVLVWAKTEKAARRLSDQFAARRVAKEYWAVVEADRHLPPEGLWDDWLASSVDASGVVQVVDRSTSGARRAVTRFRIGEGGRVPDGTLWLRLQPETGRTHQLRAQAGRRGLAVWGDRVYGSTRAFPVGIALHARALTFEHPVQKRPITVMAAPPEVWREQGIELPLTD
jgi:23S rRNA pseudouridine1911/1915/1917 synthase